MRVNIDSAQNVVPFFRKNYASFDVLYRPFLSKIVRYEKALDPLFSQMKSIGAYVSKHGLQVKRRINIFMHTFFSCLPSKDSNPAPKEEAGLCKRTLDGLTAAEQTHRPWSFGLHCVFVELPLGKGFFCPTSSFFFSQLGRTKVFGWAFDKSVCLLSWK